MKSPYNTETSQRIFLKKLSSTKMLKEEEKNLLKLSIMNTSNCSCEASKQDESDVNGFFCTTEDFEVIENGDCDTRQSETKDRNGNETMQASDIGEVPTGTDSQGNEDSHMEVALCDGSQLTMSSQQNRMRIALGVLIRLVVPLCNGFVRGWRGIRGVRLLRALRNIQASRQTLTNMLAFAANTISMSLSSVQVVHRIEPILKIMKLKKGPNAMHIGCTNERPAFTTPVSPAIKYESEETEKSVTLDILTEPPSGSPIRADVVFVHGLHGSLVNTWKQGLWKSEGRRVQFKRPPRPAIRPPKRPRHSRPSVVNPPHLTKRARYCDSYDSFESLSHDDYVPEGHHQKFKSYILEAAASGATGFCDDVEYSFPTIRLSIDDRLDRSSSPVCNHSTTNKSERNVSDAAEEEWSACWPRDWLPLDCPGVRVIALNYTTDPYLWRPVWVRKRKRSALTERTREMTDLLIEHRVGHGHPIVWVGHSKGGLFIKQILVDAWESGRPAAAPLWKFSKGVFFYSVPHRGSLMADFNLPFLRQSVELSEIQKNCPGLLELHRRFLSLYHSGQLKVDVFSFVETAMTLMSVLYLRIVGVDSADPGIGQVCGLHLDHREICKPRSRQCILYTSLIQMINKVC